MLVVVKKRSKMMRKATLMWEENEKGCGQEILAHWKGRKETW